MTDQMDHRLEELVHKLAASAPESPPFPRVASSPLVPAPRMPAWALSVAGAVAVLVLIGLPFLIFSGGTSTDPATTLPPPASTTIPTTTTPTTTLLDGTPDIVPTCPAAGLLARTLQPDGTAGHTITPIRIDNVTGSPCTLDDPTSVVGIGTGGEEIPAVLGTHTPVGEDSGSLLQAGEFRTMLVEVGTGCEGGRLIGPEAQELRISVGTVEVTVMFSGDLGCDFNYSGFARWFPEVEPVSDAERALVDGLVAWAPAPTETPIPPFADPVVLTLGPELARSQTAGSLSDGASWVFDEQDGFRAYTGPFSALDLLDDGRPFAVTAGPHNHCAGLPMPINEAFTGLRHLSIQPTDATSCIEWWTVDLFLTDEGEIAGVTLDLWEP